MAARSAGEHDWAFPRRFHRRDGSAILLLKKIRIRGCMKSRRLPARVWGVTHHASAFMIFPSYSLLSCADHALRYISRRGFTIAEVEEAIHTVPWQRTELGRLDCRKDFPYGKEWNGKTYATKQVRPVFVRRSCGSCCRDCLHILFLNL